MNIRSVYSPLGIQKMEQYRARIAGLVKDRKLTEREAECLISAELRRLANRLSRD